MLWSTVLLGGLLAACGESVPQATDGLSPPEVLQRAVRDGLIGEDRAALLLALAIAAPDQVPALFQGGQRWDATLELRSLYATHRTLEEGPVRDSLGDVLFPSPAAAEPNAPITRPPPSICSTSARPLPRSTETAHFFIEFDTIHGGLRIEDYEDALERTWTTEVDGFGWAAPPRLEGAPTAGGKYPVRIDFLGPTLYGFVSEVGTYAGLVGDNPSTGWDDVDAKASCMVLNQDFSTFPGSPRQALTATAAHEFLHSIQNGYGALDGPNAPGSHFIEGGASWVEDEVFDAADDNYGYLWPKFHQDMGSYPSYPYSYWITWRGLTERFGAGEPGGAEQVMQDFWEITGRNESENDLDALGQALVARGTTLADTFHEYAIAARFVKRCREGYAYPYCFEEADDYVDAAGVPRPHKVIEEPGGTAQGAIPDNFSMQWVKLPVGSTYGVTVTNASAGGEIRGSLACDDGSGIAVQPFAALLTGGQTEIVASFDATACRSAFVVLTNQQVTAPGAEGSIRRAYTVVTTAG